MVIAIMYSFIYIHILLYSFIYTLGADNEDDVAGADDADDENVAAGIMYSFIYIHILLYYYLYIRRGQRG